ncbi:MAG: TlpA disulfide reductase family protein [Planctomycetota bacterium]|nr:TlpA disulfide reductase family protein [Planctomycetota bacterium]MDA1214970.1 TlpA disulfide reductase family protein [Planctomycetota bacterium]
MTPLLFQIILASNLALADDPTAVMQIRYSGSLFRVNQGEEGDAVKRFSLFCLLTPNEAGKTEIFYLIDERGGGGWAWPERYGFVAVSPNADVPPTKHIQILQDHDGTKYPLSLPLPLFEDFLKVAEDAKWVTGKFEYAVQGQETVKDRECWVIEGSTNFGKAKTIAVSADSGIVVALKQKVFMGQGDQFTLLMDLESAEAVPAEDLTRFEAPLKTLRKIQDDLKRPAESLEPELTNEQLASAEPLLSQLETEADETPFGRLASVISRDVKSQLRRAGDVSELEKKFLGKQAPDFMLKTLDRKTLKTEELADKTIVLHFWEYQGEPLIEPYGQVGYLDYLNSRRSKLGTQVIGVAVDPRFGNDQRGDATRSVRKLQQFMNLSYPIAMDEGKLLEEFGDPRESGAKLPLWVVIGPGGKIVHYHVGYYSINPDEGLRTLDDAVVESIKSNRDDKKKSSE